MSAKLHILMATYNGATYIRDQIDSILSQSYTDWELLVSDDCSTDDTLSIVKEYAERDSRIRIVSSDHRFGSAKDNFINLIGFVDDGYVMFSDQDDIWHPDKVALTMSHIRNSEQLYGTDMPILVFTNLRVVTADDEIIDESFYNTLRRDPTRTALNYILIQNVVAGCTMGLNAALLRIVKQVLASGNVVTGMHDWLIAILASATGHIEYVPVATIDYRQHGNNVKGAGHFANYKMLASLLLYPKRTLTDGRERVTRSVDQARFVYESSSGLLSPKARETVLALVNIEKETKINRIKTVFEYRFWTSTYSENIVEILSLM